MLATSAVLIANEVASALDFSLQHLQLVPEKFMLHLVQPGPIRPLLHVRFSLVSLHDVKAKHTRGARHFWKKILLPQTGSVHVWHAVSGEVSD